MGQDFHWNFLVKVTRSFASFFGLFDWIALIWVWLERSHVPAQVSCKSCLGPLKLMTSQVVQRTLLNNGGYRRFRVNMLITSVIWAFQVRPLEMVSPKSFALSTTSVFSPSMTTGGKSLSALANEMRSSLHLSLFNLTLFSYPVSSSLSISLVTLTYNFWSCCVILVLPK